MRRIDDAHRAQIQRRSLLRALGGGCALAAAQGVCPPGWAASAGATRSFTAQLVALELDGVLVTRVHSVEGGFVRGLVNVNPANHSKSTAALKVDDLLIEVPLPLPRALVDWIATMLNHAPARRNGAIVRLGMGMEELSRQVFMGAYVAGLRLPTMAGSSKEAGWVLITVRVASMGWEPGTGQVRSLMNMKNATHPWACSNYRVSLDRLPCDRIAGIESLSAQFAEAPGGPAGGRDAMVVPGQTSFANPVLSVSEADGDAFLRWMQSWFFQGHRLQNDLLQGSIETMAQDMKTVLQPLSLRNVGLVSVAPDRFSDAQAPAPRLRVELYCEQFMLGYSPAEVQDLRSRPGATGA